MSIVNGETYQEKISNLVLFKDALVNINQTTTMLSDRDKRLIISTNLSIVLEILLIDASSQMEKMKKDYDNKVRPEDRDVVVDYVPLINNIRQELRTIIKCLNDIPA